MGGERDLTTLLANLEPVLSHERYRFEMIDRTEFDADTFALVREDEGITAIRVSPTGEWARICLGVQSGLDAVGLTAAFSGALTEAQISANVVAALYHDHIFVQWERREEALRVLQALA